MNESELKALDEIIDVCVSVEKAECGYEVTRHTVYFFIDGRRRVEIMLPYERYDEMAPATVNWSAIGSVDPKTAVNFARTINAAAAVAASLNTSVRRFNEEA